MRKKITCTVAKNHLFKYTFFIKTGSTWCALPLCLCMRYFITMPGEKSRDTWMLLRALSSRWPSVPLIIIYRYYIYNILHLQVYVHLQVHVYLNLIWLKLTVLKHTLPLLNIRIHSYKGHTTTERPLDKSIHWLWESITLILKWTSQSFICMYHVQF